MIFRKTASAAALLVCPVVIHSVPVAAAQDVKAPGKNEAEAAKTDTLRDGDSEEILIPPPAPPALVVPPAPPAAPAPPAPPAPVVPPPPINLASPAARTLEVIDQEAAPEHFDLYTAMKEGVDDTLVMENGLAALRRELARDPNIAALEKMSPGLIVDIAESVRPMLKDHDEYVAGIYRPRMAALFARYLTPDEAQEAADFYRSDIGRTMLKALSSNFTVDAMLADYEEDRQITQAEVDRDLNATVAAATSELSPEELRTVTSLVISSPALMKLNIMQGEIRSLRTQMENEELRPATEQAMQSAMEAVFASRFPQ
ncbi:MAG: DUF2059 domain-containing protein [Pseudomonadota bacterium]